MTNHTAATQAQRISLMHAWARASRILRNARTCVRVECWPHIEGLDVVELWRDADGLGDMRQVHTMLLCPTAQALFRQRADDQPIRN